MASPDGSARFLVWAPRAESVDVVLLGDPERTVPLERGEHGYFAGTADGVGPGARYRFRLSGDRDLPDPASRSQPEGVHGASEVVGSPEDGWDDHGWQGPPFEDYVVYELHVGTFTEQGTFDAAALYLDGLVDLGITAVEVMPIAQFPGSRNWGYDGVFPYAAQDSYGGPEAFRRFVAECHRRGLAVVLDVVYNHLGPEGNVLGEFGPYFSDRYRQAWGKAINFDGPGSDEVRRFFLGSALQWLEEFHADALRIDAMHAILDSSARPFLQELAEAVDELSGRLGRPLYLVAESDLNDARFVTPVGQGGVGLHAQWNDDFHHALHALLTGERGGYYLDFGTVGHLARAFTDGYVYQGEYSAFRDRRHGNSSRSVPAGRLVVFSQNHDQVGNRARGDRLSTLVSVEAQKLASGVVALSPYVPLLFMGQEYGETAPFPYFISLSDPKLVRSVQRGRTAEFESFGWSREVLDPQDEATFASARLDRTLRELEPHRSLLEFHRELLALRRGHPALAHLSKQDMAVSADDEAGVLMARRRSGTNEVLAVFHFGDGARVAVAGLEGRWQKLMDSADERWGGPGSQTPDELGQDERLQLGPTSFVLYGRTGG
ncbi:MAG: malto-oligosyltrehalose trehalohydrolase [Actinomycetota bacterium]|nr:malto-oligosyltrehalose trehalohydrolase [Actinomycetota bacterium]